MHFLSFSVNSVDTRDAENAVERNFDFLRFGAEEKEEHCSFVRRSQHRIARRNKSLGDDRNNNNNDDDDYHYDDGEERTRPKSAFANCDGKTRRIINGGGIGGSRAFRSMAGNLNNFALREKTPPAEFRLDHFHGNNDFRSLAADYYDNKSRLNNNSNAFRRYLTATLFSSHDSLLCSYVFAA